MISVLILTKNEERDLPECLAALAACDDVHVFDSCSTDQTLALATAMGAHVHTRPFDSYAAQRNAALDTIAFRHPWVLILDADERMNPALWVEALAAVQAAGPGLHAFRIRRDDYFLGAPLRRAQIMPFYTRLLRLGKARYTREINEFLEVEGDIGQLRASFAHYPFSKGLSRWFEKHNVYSSMEARIVAERSFAQEVSLRTAFFHPDLHTRHRARKAIFYMLPGRPLLRWLYLLVVRRGLLDGRPGIIYATLQAGYEWQIMLKTKELLAANRGHLRAIDDAPTRPNPAAAVYTGVDPGPGSSKQGWTGAASG